MRFSTQPEPRRAPEQAKNHEQKLPENPSMPQVSFKDLGMSRNVKVFVYLVIGVLGTMESIFWVKAIWRWYKGGEEEKS